MPRKRKNQNMTFRYEVMSNWLSNYPPDQLCYFVHEKTGRVRVMTPDDPDASKIQYLPDDVTPMLPVSFDYVRQHYPSVAGPILAHPRARRAPTGPKRKGK